MIRQEEIALVIDSQRITFLQQDAGLLRDTLSEISAVDSFATIITGIRRCGKSTLLLQLLRRDYQDALYLNFDDIRLSGFETDDLIRLHQEIEKRGVRVLFFDEIQLIKGWERYVNQLLREGYTVFITGSNASMLSVELGTHLTGRHLSTELFPFSYSEYIRFKKIENEENAVLNYLKSGGIPEFVKTGNSGIINALIDDILIRDIGVRHAVRDVASLRQLAVFLITNIGNLISANKLTGMFNIKSPATFLEYFSYLKDAYILDFIPLFHHSLKTQARNPKKVYVMDMGLYTESSISTSDNMGRRLENLVFLHLRRKYKQLFYYKGKGECDFIAMEKNSVKEVIQVCLDVNNENFDREYTGLSEAMKNLNIMEGTIVTLNQSDRFQKDGFHIKMIPAADFFE
ncbi:ATP-binding protein [Bacteroidales bacterium OttesenSCG-928-C03]|nr:ATP-binding protein [Bacteroidales bacterium OttesenSCG-928-E04]MDL2308689.1 ATP-binding protein [Bacteroidales bacterium OttesenSCG-928-C03]MDL2325961.1 ATP-binding protein [Bacteroidales bacterium OttesenSCG-928-A14]